MPHEATRIRFSGTYAAVLASLLVIAVIVLPLAVFGFFIPQPWSYFWAALMLSAAIAVIVRSRRISLVVAPDGVEVHNLWRSYRLPWESIEAIAPTMRSMLGEGPGEQTIEFVLRGGQRVHSQATFGPPMAYAPVLQEIQMYADGWNIQMTEPENTIVT